MPMLDPTDRRPLWWTGWALVAAAVLVQIGYPLTPPALRTAVTITSVVVFAAASIMDAGRRHGPRGAVVLVAVAGGGGLVAEAVGVATGLPFGGFTHPGTLRAEPVRAAPGVPLAWVVVAPPPLGV